MDHIHLLVVGQLRARGSAVADPSVITHPAYRDRGHGQRLLSTMLETAVSGGTLVLYQSLLSNGPAISLAQRLGFQQYATLLAVRLI